MKVEVIENNFSGCPPELKTSGFTAETLVDLSIGEELNVYGMSVFYGVVFVLIKDHSGIYSWMPNWLFKVLDGRFPKDWVSNFFHDNPSCIIGPEIIASDLERYSRFIEQDPDLVTKMNLWVDSMESG